MTDILSFHVLSWFFFLFTRQINSESKFSLMSFGPSSRRHSSLLRGVGAVVDVRRARRSGGTRWSGWPHWPWFSPWSWWPNDPRESCLALDTLRPCRSWCAIFTRRAHITFQAPLTFGSWLTKRPLGSFDTWWPSVATRACFTRCSFRASKTSLPSRSTASYWASITFAARQSLGSSGATLTPIPFRPRWSRSPCWWNVVGWITKKIKKSGSTMFCFYFIFDSICCTFQYSEVPYDLCV